MRRLLTAALLVLSPRLVLGEGEQADAVRAAWRFRRTVTVGAGDRALAAIPLPPEVLAKSTPDLRDLRLVDEEGRDLPTTQRRLEPRVATASWTGRLVDARKEKGTSSLWVVDLGQEQTFDTVTLEIPREDFAKGIRIEGSPDGKTWRTVREDAGVFDRQWSLRIHHTTIDCPAPVSARFLRLTADDRRSPPIVVQGVSVSSTRSLAGERWRFPVSLRALPRSGDHRSSWLLELPAGFPFDEVEITSTTPVFSRTASLVDVREANGGRVEKTSASGQVYRLSLGDALVSGEHRTLRVTEPPLGSLTLAIEDGDSPPLENVKAVVSGPAVQLVFPAARGPFLLYYGNPATRGPLYDLAALQTRIASTESFATADLGPEVQNASYRRVPPLAFASTRGAPIDPREWSHLRALSVVGVEDIVTALLDAQDVALSQPDYADVRVVDPQDRQVPFILEPHATLERVTLRVDSAPVEVAGRHSTRHRMSARAADGRPLRVGLESLEISFVEPFFSRAARLFVPSEMGAGDHLLVSTTIDRRPGTAGPILLPGGGFPAIEWDLDIEEGDNAPLATPTASGIVAVPRVVFKAGPGAYSLLVGNRLAQRPQYDIASLRGDLLAYSATVVTPGPLTPNHRFRKRLSDYTAEGPSAVGLWAVLLGGVAILLVLTVRILRGAPPS